MRAICAGLLCLYPAFAQTDLIGLSPSSQIKTDSRPEAVAFSGDGSFIVIATRSGAFVSATRPNSGAQRFASGPVRAAAITRDGANVAAGSEAGEITLATAAAAAAVARFRPHRGAVLSLSFSPDGSRLISCGADKGIVVSDAANGREMSRLANPAGKVFVFVGFSAHNNSAVGVSESGLVVEWDPATGRVVRQTQDADPAVFSGALNDAGTLLAISTEFAKLNKAALNRTASPSDFHREERLAIYDLTQGKMVKEIDGVDGQHRSLSFSADSRYLSAVREKVRGSFVSVYDVQRGTEVESTPAQNGAPAAAFSPDGRWFTQADTSGGLTIFAVTGVQRGADVGDISGKKYQITSQQTAPLLAPAQPLRLAVMDLEVNGGDTSIGRAIADQIRNRINGTPNIEVIERRAWAQVINEQNLQMSDRIDPLTAVTLGRGLGLKKMIFGSISKLDTTYTINVRVIDVETLKNDGEREVTCQRCSLEDLPGAVAVLRTALVRE
ncbi:MAG TPA: CsgG/HfaB family protein [Verrucomicrobiae bacterium]|nr:CsgG/HfaB family protein [Verrucomicrobiae bacterium]